MEMLANVFSEQSFMPHGHCYLWTPALVWLEVLSNVSIGVSYLAISIVLGLLVARVRSLPFRWVYVAFGAFIVACGLTHFMDVWVIWQPRYWLDGLVRAVTALASVATAFALPQIFPEVVALVRHAELAQKRGLALEASVADMETTYRKARELDEARTAFFANASHELRTPLTLILGPLEQLLRESDLPEDARNALHMIARNAKLLLNHVHDLLDLARLDAHRLEPSFHNVDLALLVRDAVDHFRPLAHAHHVQLELESPPELITRVDPEKVQRIVFNLLSNAFKFTPAGGRIRCSLSLHGPASACARIAVADSGPGVPKDEWPHLFQRFHQGPRPPCGGTGLGLALVRELSELHGGRAWVADAEEGGALFCAELPRREPRGEAAPRQEHPPGPVAVLAEHAPESRMEAHGDEADTRPLVLVVEDNSDMRSFIARTLGAEYQVALASDGEAGLAQARALMPDLILADLMMPRLTGDQLVAAVRTSPEIASIPIVLLTAKADPELRERMLQQGAQDYVLKPFSADELRARAAIQVATKRSRDVLRQALSENERDLERLSRLLVARSEQLRGALEEAREASRLKTDFLSLVSHELRTPLASMQLQLEVLRRLHPANPRERSALDRIGRAYKRLVDLVDSLLDLGRVESGHLDVRVAPVNLEAQVNEVLDELRPNAERKGLTLRAEIANGVSPIESDPTLCRIILVNLVENAIKYTDQGAVWVSVRADANGVVLDVSDSGPGIDPSLHERVFEPFVQGEEVRHKHTPGVGLGLSLVRGMARALGGDVWLTSRVGQGSTFHVSLTSVRASR